MAPVISCLRWGSAVKFWSRLVANCPLARHFASGLHLANAHLWTAEEQAELNRCFFASENFVTVEEESSLLQEVESFLKRHRYEKEHWDDTILNYRETEKSTWKSENQLLIDRIREFAFTEGVRHQESVHVLDLAKDGVVKPHVDSVRFCGDVVAGLNLLSDVVFRLKCSSDPKKMADLLVRRRALYVLRGIARYECTHETLSGKDSVYEGEPVIRERRIALICRSYPNGSNL